MRPSIVFAILVSASALAQPQGQSRKNDAPKLFVAARYAYVEATDGDSFDPHVLPDNHRAIADVQHALTDWKRYILKAKRREADLVFVVRKGDLAAVQGGIRAHGGVENPENNGNPRTTGNTGVTTIIGARAASPDDLLEVYAVNPDGSLQGPLWRQYLRDGLDPPEIPLLKQFRKAVEAASKP